MSLFDQIGADRLRAVLEDFYDRVFADVMIGFLFRGQDKARLVELEYQLTARHLGADVRYTGRSMRDAHAAHPIMKGHFLRRNKILEDTLNDHAVPSPVFAAWMEHARALESAILGAARHSEHCDHDLQRARATDQGDDAR